MIHYFTFGEGAKRGVLVTTAMADAFNRFNKSFSDAQAMFLKSNGRPWTPSEVLPMPFGDPGQMRDVADMDLYNRMSKLCTKQYWIRNHIIRRPIREEHMPSDFLTRKF